MLSARLLIAGLGIVVGGGCSASDLPPFAIGLEFGERTEQGCPSRSCADYSLDCGAVVSVRVFDGNTRPDDDVEPLAATCVEAGPATDLCSLSDLGIDLGAVKQQRVRIEVAMWLPESLTDGCPDGSMFDLAGVPKQGFSPAPAFAGAMSFNLDDDGLSVASVPLSCFDEDPLSQCTANTTDVTAGVDDLDTLLFAPIETAENFRISVGEPRGRPGPNDQTIYVLEAIDDFELPLIDAAPVPLFGEALPKKFAETACTVVLDITPQSTAAVTCNQVDSQAASVDLVGYFVRKERLDEILAALGRTVFPPEGLVVGRVVDHTRQPASEVTVAALSPTGDPIEVLYLSQDFSLATTAPTVNHAYFVSSAAPFGSLWSASHPDGREQLAVQRTGIIEGKLTVVVIELEEPLGQPQ